MMLRPAYLDGPTWRRFIDANPPLCVGQGPHWGMLTVDHVLPRIRGGTHDLSNLQWLCLGCNVRKGVHEDKRWQEETWFDRLLNVAALRRNNAAMPDLRLSGSLTLVLALAGCMGGVAAGTAGCTIRMFGLEVRRATGARSSIGSKPSFA